MKKKKLIICILLLVCICGNIKAQVKIGDNPTTINSNSMLEVESTNKGLLLPRVQLSSTSSFLPMASHVAGMIVYNTANLNNVSEGYYYNDGSKWIRIANATDTSSNWRTIGNNGIDTAVNFLGTTDNVPLVFRVNNTLAGILPVNSLASVGFGVNALSANTTGMLNTAIGALTLSANTIGTANTATGGSVLESNTTGSFNTGVGYSALGRNEDGKENVALGSNALNTSISGSYNAAVGKSALQNTLGNYNTGIGFDANRTVTTGNNNLALGARTAVMDGTLNNQMNIGNIIFGVNMQGSSIRNEADTVRASITPGGNIGINIIAPTATLAISNLESTTIPALQIKTPFTGASTDSVLTWNPADSTVRIISPSNILQSSGLILPIKSVTTDYTLTATDYKILVRGATTVDIVITLPNPTTCQGRIYVIQNMNDLAGLQFNYEIEIGLGTKILANTTACTNINYGNSFSSGGSLCLQSDGAVWTAITQ